MCFQVPGSVTFDAKCFSADVTGKWFCPSVDAIVPLKVAQVNKAFITMAAFQRLLPCVNMLDMGTIMILIKK